MSADDAQQAAQEGFDLLAAGPLGGTEHDGDEAAHVVEHFRLVESRIRRNAH